MGLRRASREEDTNDVIAGYSPSCSTPRPLSGHHFQAGARIRKEGRTGGGTGGAGGSCGLTVVHLMSVLVFLIVERGEGQNVEEEQ